MVEYDSKQPVDVGGSSPPTATKKSIDRKNILSKEISNLCKDFADSLQRFPQLFGKSLQILTKELKSNNVCMRLALFIPKFTNKLGLDGSVRHSDYMEERLHLFATMMSIYPFTETTEIAKEFMLTEREVKFWAWLYGIKKNKQYRRQICIDNGRLQFLKNIWGKKKEGL